MGQNTEDKKTRGSENGGQGKTEREGWKIKGNGEKRKKIYKRDKKGEVKK